MTGTAVLLAQAQQGNIAATARLLSIVENDEFPVAEVIRATHAKTGHAKVIGITGPPGADKSSLVSSLVAAYRATYPRVAVMAVDPSSPFTGGAILGDRIRMRERFLDEGVFIRSMANRGNSGGLARATRRVVNVLDALGFDIILVETVGVGQKEVEVVRVVDTVCLVTIPGAGDDIQAIKSGIVEIADVLVVNKADRPGADHAVKDFRKC
ncbi:MAG: methylmalonyl Co-A mutase-associated GTPase MeaB [Aestuariivirga sp.]|nr:methylmalonyl Co-A mutase-associated GTPase MeaB [Aestuariivirga sp.]